MLVTRKEEVAKGAGGEAYESRQRQVTQVDGLVALDVLYLAKGAALPRDRPQLDRKDGYQGQPVAAAG